MQNTNELTITLEDIWKTVLLFGIIGSFFAASGAKTLGSTLLESVFMLFCLWMLIFKKYRRKTDEGKSD